jgi:hypothetical protein
VVWTAWATDQSRWCPDSVTTTSSPFEADTVEPSLEKVRVTFFATGVDVGEALATNVPVDTSARVETASAIARAVDFLRMAFPFWSGRRRFSTPSTNGNAVAP